MTQAVDRSGVRYGRLVAVARAESTKWGQARWECRCDCGQVTVVTGTKLGRDTHSCGCLFLERVAEMGRGGRLESVSYNGAHYRVRRARGSASEHACVDCSEQAMDWSYDKNDPNEALGIIVLQDGRKVEAPYSFEPEFYSPRCRSCHVRFDAA